MVTGSDLLSALNSNQPVNISNYFSRLGIKESSNSLPEGARQGIDTVSFSDEARKLFADRTKSDVEVIQGLIDKAMDMLRGRHAPSNEIEKAYGLDALNNKVGESKNRLDELTENLRGALTKGDKSAATIAEKEIVQFFNDLQAAQAGGSDNTA
ncbi:MAG: hypothetical protein LBQ86_04125, partial [Holophagales bacterium]|nr:hypothetical protein [Holophagales bacterium]